MAMENMQGAIIGSQGYDNTFAITLTNDSGEVVKDVKAMFHMRDYNILGVFDEENECYWFTIPAELAYGSYLYNITIDDEPLIFPDKIRFRGGV